MFVEKESLNRFALFVVSITIGIDDGRRWMDGGNEYARINNNTV